MIRRALFLVALSGLLLVHLACKKEGGEGGGGLFSSAKKEVRVGIVGEVAASPVLVALKQGGFETRGVSVSLTTHGSTEEIAAQLAAGKLDLGMLYPAQALLPEARVVVPYVLARNGGGVTVTPEVWAQLEPGLLRDAVNEEIRPIHGDALLPVVQSMREDAPRMTFVVDSDHASSTYAICYWLGAAGITPVWGDSPASPAHAHLERARVEVTTVPVSLGSFHGRAGCRDGNSSGVPLIRDYDVVRDLPTAVLAASRSWAGENRATLVSTLAALVEASNWLDASMESRREASGEFEAMFPGVSSNVLMDSSASAIIFGRNASAAPNRSHALWLLTQMIRWGHLPSSLGDAELVEMAESAFRADVFREAVVASGSELSGMEARLEDDVLTYLIDGNHFRSQKPSAYAASFEISVR